MKIVITAGGTSERIDDVRTITNSSTGSLGFAIGTAFTKADEIEVRENDDVVEYVRSKLVGDVIEFTVYRDGEYLTIPVTIGDMNRFSD